MKKENISKRVTVDNSIIKELQEKYPKVNKNGVEYDLGLTYFTFETDYFSSTPVRRIIKTYGAEIVSVICFFREQMCQPHGWYTRVDGFSGERFSWSLQYLKNKEKESLYANWVLRLLPT